MAKKPLRSSASRPSKAANDDTLDLTTLPPAQTVVRLPENASAFRNLDFGRFYGTGCDVVVYACQRTLERMAEGSAKSAGKTLSPATIRYYFGSGLAAFLPHCATMAAALGRELRLDDIDRDLIDHFIAELRQSGGTLSTPKNRYAAAKSVLVAMGQSGWITQDIFPRNPFPNSNRSKKGQAALSEPERKAVLRALKADMRDIIKGSDPLTSEELSVCLLAIAARTGLNPTPALELLTDCLQPHPLKADRYVLVSYKRRGNATRIQSLRRSADIEAMVTALPDVARVIDLIRDRNAEPRQSSQHPSSLFVYESRGLNTAGAKSRLSNNVLSHGITAFCKRHDLRDADGKPLRLNLMRLRKTFENRLFSLSGQDPFLTAKLGGHTPKVSNDHYLEAPETAERDWHLMGEIRTEQLLSHGKVAPLPTQNTPVAQCRDTLTGELAPQNGEHCQRFLACLRCKSFVVTGDDLYRVFSLYWMLVGMRQRMGASAWKRVYGHIIRIIDREIAPQFDAELVTIQRQRAKADPHPFWRDPDLLEGAA
ncbi:hypothetical protein [Abyssibacter profundi]|uniref:Core-binding (CB) domain-containing protein n=1 Tax=Abyssibacter profundi TaxID=2182787 RepID=A0A363ULX4_9GAMM|nr:hypothetical protein [Abyssibacter profundi]PWN56429.1 hypothetical protein DEH80_06225 [Abyssibacter profundi]